MRLALRVAAADDACGGAVCRAHAVAEQDDDVLRGLGLVPEGDDLEVARRAHGLRVALRRTHGERVDARPGVRMSTLRNDRRVDISAA
jgi:hypothetical protein